MAEQKLIANRYRIDELIGEGGMGAVYKGTDTRNNQRVAIKQLRNDTLIDSAEAIERFRREVEALRRLDHPNIVRLLGTAREGKHYYIIMEFVGGGSLASYLSSQSSPLPVERALHIALDLSDALARAHRLNIVHRDLKPDNILLTEKGIPRLTDFGIARIGDKSRLTESGHIMGTGPYLSPEACRGYELDARADIWAFGVLLYEMLTGRRPFGGNGTAAIVVAIMMEPLPNIRQMRPDLPPALATLIEQMLEKNRENRTRSIRQVGAQIEAILNGEDINAVSIESTPNDADLFTALMELADKWEALAQNARQLAADTQLSNNPKSYFQRGVSNSYREAAQDLRELLSTGEDATVPEGDLLPMFVEVSRREVEQVFERAGMKFKSLYEDKGYVFTVVFAKLPPQSFDDRIAKMRAVCDTIVVLETGRLEETQQPYIDFGFTAPPR